MFRIELEFVNDNDDDLYDKVRKIDPKQKIILNMIPRIGETISFKTRKNRTGLTETYFGSIEKVHHYVPSGLPDENIDAKLSLYIYQVEND